MKGITVRRKNVESAFVCLSFQLSINSTEENTICLCNHLTSFGSDFVVPPNTIDFSTVWSKFKDLNENAAVFSTVISVLCLYVIVVIWARYKDKQDVVKVCNKSIFFRNLLVLKRSVFVV